MNTPYPNFECDSSKLFRSITVPTIIFGIFMLVITTGFGAFILFSMEKTGFGTKFNASVIQGTIILDLIQVVSMVMVARWSLGVTARKIQIKRDELLIETGLGETSIPWTDIAVVGQVQHWRGRLAFIKTYDAKIVGIGPQLKVTDELLDGINSHATFTVASDPTLAWDRRTKLWINELWVFCARPVIVVVAATLLGFSGYSTWLQQRDPVWDLAGPQDLNREPFAVHSGKGMKIYNYGLTNTGRETRGIKFELSGDSLTLQALKNPKVLITAYDRESFHGDDYLALHPHRELISLRNEAGDRWTGVSTTLPVKHGRDFVSQMVHTFSCMIVPASASSLQQELKLELFADVEKFKDKRHLVLTVAPLDYPNAAVKNDTLLVRNDDFEYESSVCAVGLPSSFPVPIYPNSTIREVRKDTAALYVQADVESILKFYKHQFTQKKWKVVEEKTSQPATHRELVAKKGHWKFRVSMNSNSKGTHYELFMMWV